MGEQFLMFKSNVLPPSSRVLVPLDLWKWKHYVPVEHPEAT